MDEREQPGIDDFDDPGLGDLLRRYADDLTGHTDTEGALVGVQRRARARRRWRVATSSVVAAAAAAVLVIGTAALGDGNQATVQAPAASGVAATTTVGSTASTAPTVSQPPASVLTSSSPSLPALPGAPPTTPAVTVPPTSVVPATQAVTTTTFTSTGGSIVVRLAGGTLGLDRAPSPSAGWSFRIDDDGPSRVRVRFERDGQRSEIRVDLRDGVLVPEIVES